MRLQRSVPVAGIDAELARSIARACAGSEPYLEGIAYRVKQPIDEVRPLVPRLVAEGYRERMDRQGRAPD